MCKITIFLCIPQSRSSSFRSLRILHLLQHHGSQDACRASTVAAAGLVLAVPCFAQVSGSSPWENAVNVLQAAFTSTIARGLSLVAIVVSGLTFAFGEGG